MKSIAVCSGKGGAGKTVVSSALATMLSELGFRVLLVDADYSVAGLSYLTLKELHKLEQEELTFQEVISNPIRVIETLFDLNLGDNDYIEEKEEENNINPNNGAVWLIQSNLDKYASLETSMEDSFENIFNSYSKFINIIKINKIVDYVITDCRAGLDQVSAAIALSSDDVLVLMEQDRVSWRSSTRFVTNALVLKDKIENGKKINVEFYYLPNKVNRAFVKSLQVMGGEFPGNVLGGIPLDINFFNRYFKDIFIYSPEGKGWKRTTFYRYLRLSLSQIIPNLPKAKYSIFAELLDTISLLFFSLSPRVTILSIAFLGYLVVTMWYIFLVYYKGRLF